uniref:Uncharacterized protein n=1 Tax=Ananas comosus var. bracteatus TaxID=296719 RepID=A0A6V7Q2G6_ANACO|nr:unnamed protein product [Ananas comosus var. bracteatus]
MSSLPLHGSNLHSLGIKAHSSLHQGVLERQEGHGGRGSSVVRCDPSSSAAMFVESDPSKDHPDPAPSNPKPLDLDKSAAAAIKGGAPPRRSSPSPTSAKTLS